MISDLSTDFTVIALALTTAHAQHEPFQLKLRRRRRRFVYLNGCSLWKAVQAHALLARSLVDTVRAGREREHNRLRESTAPKATPMALVHPLSRSLSLSLPLFVIVRAENACCDRLTLTYDGLSLPPSLLTTPLFFVCLCVCVSLSAFALP